LSTFDFASDDKQTKVKAREMLRMVEAVNSNHLTKLDDRSDPPIEVRCATCHHGQSRPRTLVYVLLEAHSEGGVEGITQKYVELREEYFGSWTFDFSEVQLVEVGQQLGAAGYHDDGIEILTINLEHFPTSGSTHFAIGEIQLAKADTSAAIASYKKSLELAPRNRAARRRLADLEGQ
jgi:tetratricopeptide (TPR) repeat protein